MESLLRDVRHALVSLRRAPAFSTTAILTLALGSGAAVAVFAIVNLVLLKPPPYRDPSSVVLIWADPPEGGRTWLSVPELDDLSHDATTLAGVAGLTDLRMNLTGDGPPEEMQLVAASGTTFRLLGVDAAIGRTFDPEDDRVGADPVIVLSDPFWRRRFGADPSIVGRTILLDGRSYLVRGVLPAGFTVLPPSSVFPANIDGWMPLVPQAPSRQRDIRYLHAIARLAPGDTLDTAAHELRGLAAAYSRAYPQTYRPSGWTFSIVPFQADVVREARPSLIAVSGIVAGVFAIACVNVANLLLARGERRRRELVVRVALGARPGRLIQLLCAEAVVLGGAGYGLGAALALVVPGFVATLDPQAFPGLAAASVLDWRLFAFVAALLGLVVLLFSLVPAIEAFRARDASSVDRSAGRSLRSAAIGRLLAASQIGLASIALVSTALLVRTVIKLQQVPSGIDAHGALTFRISLPASYRTGQEITSFFEDAADSLHELHGVISAGAVTQLPMSGASLGSTFQPWPGIDGRAVDADLRGTTEGYFAAMGIPIVAGRAFRETDTADRSSVAIVDRAFARRLRTDGNVLGLRIRWMRRPDDPIEIVGVAAEVRHRGPAAAARETVYRPVRQYARSSMTFVLRTTGDPALLARPAGDLIRRLDATQPLADVMPMNEVVGRALARPRLAAVFASALGMLALIVSVVGVYGVLSYRVSQRVREFAVRAALGAAPWSIRRLVLREGALVMAGGLAIGLSLAPAATHALNAALFGVGSTDAVSYIAAGTTLAVATVTACLVPARRASRADPMSVLRNE
ncbi:MAG TPA: ABC transporter permease [Vicinamibacterales bacterium]